jgi:hypothetical protein
MNDKERAARDKQYRAAIWERATEALLRIEDDDFDGMWQSNFIAKARIACRPASPTMAMQTVL